MKKTDVAEVRPTYKRKHLIGAKKVTNSQIVYELIKSFIGQDMEYRESFYLVLLDRANSILGVSKVSEGGISGTVADGKIIFQTALITNSSAIILCHNHPSGQLKPSDNDINLTRKMVEFGKMIDLPILDHLIVTANGYYSFADEGKL